MRSGSDSVGDDFVEAPRTAGVVAAGFCRFAAIGGSEDAAIAICGFDDGVDCVGRLWRNGDHPDLPLSEPDLSRPGLLQVAPASVDL